MIVFGPPLARLPMIVPPAPAGSETSSDTLAFGQAGPAAVSSASARLRLAAGSSLFEHPPPSWAVTDTDVTSPPFAPGGLEFAARRQLVNLGHGREDRLHVVGHQRV